MSTEPTSPEQKIHGSFDRGRLETLQALAAKHGYTDTADELSAVLSGQECACGHTRHWHGQEIGAEGGSGACERCGDCEKFTAAPQQQPPVSRGEAERLEEIAHRISESTDPRDQQHAAFLRSLAKGREGSGAESERARADRLEIENRELEDANRSLVKMRDAALEGNLATEQPPVGREEAAAGREAVGRAWEESGRSALDELFEAVDPRDGSMPDRFAAGMLASHAWAEVKRLRQLASGGREEALREALEAVLASDDAAERAAKAWAATLVRRGYERPVPPPELAAARNSLRAVQRLIADAILDTNPSPASGGGEPHKKALTLEEKERAEAEGAASGQCPFCEGGMDALGGIHTKDCPMLAPPVAATTKKPEAPDLECDAIDDFGQGRPYYRCHLSAGHEGDHKSLRPDGVAKHIWPNQGPEQPKGEGR